MHSSYWQIMNCMIYCYVPIATEISQPEVQQKVCNAHFKNNDDCMKQYEPTQSLWYYAYVIFYRVCKETNKKFDN